MDELTTRSKGNLDEKWKIFRLQYWGVSDVSEPLTMKLQQNPFFGMCLLKRDSKPTPALRAYPGSDHSLIQKCQSPLCLWFLGMRFSKIYN